MPDFDTPIPSSQDQAQDAILYIQGLDVQPLEQTAHRIASAFKACKVSARSAYMVNAGHEVEYSTTKAARLKSKVFTIQKRNSDGSSKNIIDLYEFEYIDALTKSGKDGNLIVKTLRVAIQLVVNVPRLWNVFVRRKSQKTLMDRLQFVYASCVMLLLVVYLGVLLTAVYDTVTHAFSKPPVGNAQSLA